MRNATRERERERERTSRWWIVLCNVPCAGRKGKGWKLGWEERLVGRKLGWGESWGGGKVGVEGKIGWEESWGRDVWFCIDSACICPYRYTFLS